MEGLPHPDGHSGDGFAGRDAPGGPGRQNAVAEGLPPTDSTVSDSRKRKHDNVDAPEQQQPQPLPPQQREIPDALPMANQTDMQPQGLGVHQVMNVPFVQPAMQMPPASGMPDNQLAMALDQQNHNIFGLTSMQLQQLLLVQMQMAQLQNTPGAQNPGQASAMSSQNTMHAAQMMAHVQAQAQAQAQQAQNFFNGNQSTVMAAAQPSQQQLQYIQPSIPHMSSYPQGQTLAVAQTNRQTVVSGSGAAAAQMPGPGDPGDSSGQLAGRSPIVLYMSCDEESLSEYQCLVRKNIELFEAIQIDAESNAQGRNKPIVLGQVGIRCRHCTMLAPKNRSRGAMYYPAKLEGLYQAAQNQANGHLVQHCNHVPPAIRAELIRLKDVKSSAGGGKKYWADGVKVLGVFEDANGLRFKKR